MTKSGNGVIFDKKLKGRVAMEDAWIYGSFYGAQLSLLHGYVVPSDLNVDKVAEVTEHVRKKFSSKIYWQNTRSDNFQLYEQWWQKLRNA
ncbi:MAG: hypothetical protein COB24_05630 [Hyphomicrobiales bacterium]|nr:MAG: hypothetical protein COB24_05630 [Hyphomicrobiales bacterium]